jgi:hypothetical protein
LDLWTLALRNRNAEWGRAVILLLLLAKLHNGDTNGPPHRPWGLPRGARFRSRRAYHESLTGRRPRG